MRRTIDHHQLNESGATHQATDAGRSPDDAVVTGDDDQILDRLLQFPLAALGQRLLPPGRSHCLVQDPRVVCPVHAQFECLRGGGGLIMLDRLVWPPFSPLSLLSYLAEDFRGQLMREASNNYSGVQVL